ncbi:unnamed protein product [Darwinula stevensoni]|uniref:Uncharacterized protein n=1 Tax=Darwinula stevensoni TaxID=69355 RepID=A0A7R8XEG2_9CRUS|nr:unnamed protein product [Darwinula stevensoni]CAG0889537.1 unnamed protein product [Darwinula stevensoni]
MNNHGILSLLDEECLRSGNVTDDTFLLKLTQICAGHPNFESRGMKNFLADDSLPKNCFRVRHFAGNVIYSVRGFIEKNSDVLARDISTAMFRCSHPLLQVLFPEGNPKRTHLKRAATAGTQFRIGVAALVRTLRGKTARHVRCIKTNEFRQPRKFDNALVQHQVRYMGLVELTRLKRQGYALRMTYEAFLARYRLLSVHTWPRWREGCAQEGTMCLLRDLLVSPSDFAYGRTKVFIRSPRTVCDLEEFRSERMYDLATVIQKVWRGWRHRNWLRQARWSQTVIARAWRKWRRRRRMREVHWRHRAQWAAVAIQRCYFSWKKRQWLLRLANRLPPMSPLNRDWPSCPRRCSDASLILRRLYHKWRCHVYRLRFDQTARNRMREKVTASILFKDRKASYIRSVGHPFLGDYVRLRQNAQWKKMSSDTNDQYVVFADIINKINRSSGRFVPVLFVLSTSAMLILDQRTMQVKYRVPAGDIYRLSLSPFFDDIAVFHVKPPSPSSDTSNALMSCGPSSHGMGPGSHPAAGPGCLFLPSDISRKKGDFVFQTGHVIEIVTKLFLVIQNATGKPPEINLSTDKRHEAIFLLAPPRFTVDTSKRSTSKSRNRVANGALEIPLAEREHRPHCWPREQHITMLRTRQLSRSTNVVSMKQRAAKTCDKSGVIYWQAMMHLDGDAPAAASGLPDHYSTAFGRENGRKQTEAEGKTSTFGSLVQPRTKPEYRTVGGLPSIAIPVAASSEKHRLPCVRTSREGEMTGGKRKKPGHPHFSIAFNFMCSMRIPRYWGIACAV